MTTMLLRMPVVPVLAAHRRAYLLSETGVRVEFHRTPPGSSADGDTATFATIERPGMLPLSRRSSATLRTITISPQVGDDNPETSCEATLAALRALAGSGQRVQLVWGRLERGWWNITAMPITVISRVQGSNDVSRCTVELALTQANDLVVTPGSTSTSGGGGTAGWKTVTVKSGDTLYKLATKYLGRGNRWGEIAKANKIKNPKASTRLKVGKKLKIPPR